MIEPKLKPCPFCGRRGTTRSTPEPAYRDREWWIECGNNVCRVRPETDKFATLATATAWWNGERVKRAK